MPISYRCFMHTAPGKHNTDADVLSRLPRHTSHTDYDTITSDMLITLSQSHVENGYIETMCFNQHVLDEFISSSVSG